MNYDAVLVGGALAGKTLGLILHSLGWRVAILEAASDGMPAKKLFALHRGSLEFLNHWVEPGFFEQYGTPIHSVWVSQRGAFGTLRFSAQEIGVDLLGRVLPSEYLEAELLQKVQKNKIPYFTSTRVVRLRELQNEIAIDCEPHYAELSKTLHAKWVFACDGVQSSVRALSGISVLQHDAQEIALVFKSRWEQDHQGIAFEKKNEKGVLALLPLPDKTCASIWSGNAAQLQTLARCETAQFIAELEKAFGRRLGRCLEIQWTGQYPLRCVKAQQRQKGRVILMGNAAHAVYPIAAQGFNMALSEMAILKNQLSSDVVNSVEAMSAILEILNPIMKAGVQSSSVLAELFRWNFSGSKTIFNLGLGMLNLLSPAKKYVLNQLMGQVSF